MYKLFLLKPTTGQIIHSCEEPYDTDKVFSYKVRFKTLEEALSAKDDLLKKVEWAVVQIYNSSSNEDTFYSNRDIEQQYISEITAMNKYRALPWYKKLIKKKPKLTYLKI